MSDQSKTSSLRFEGVIPIGIRLIDADEENLERERLQAQFRTEALYAEGRNASEPRHDVDDDEIAAAVRRLEQKIDHIFIQRHAIGPQTLQEHWVILTACNMEVRLAKISDWDFPVNQLLELRFILPHITDRIFVLLASCRSVETLSKNFRKIDLQFELIHTQTQDEIARAAFLAERISRRQP